MRDLLNKILLTVAGALLAVFFAAVALVVGGRALNGAGDGSEDALLLALVAAAVVASAGRSFRRARASLGAKRQGAYAVAARAGRSRVGSFVGRPSL